MSFEAGAKPRAEGENLLARIALRFAAWSEHWFPDAFIFAAAAVVVVAVAALVNGASAAVVTKSFGDGFWSLIPFTMQQVMVVISGYVIASSPPVARLIDRIAALPRSGRGAVAFIAIVTMALSLINWALSLVFGGLLARAIAEREDLKMDYRAAGAAAYMGLGCTWALGVSSSAAQLQANAGAMPKALIEITGVIPFTQTIFLWQSMAMLAVLTVVSTLIAYWSAPSPSRAVTASMMGIDAATRTPPLRPRERPGEYLEYSPAITLLLAALAGGWLIQEFAAKNWILAISNLNTYNFGLLMLGLLLHWRPRSFLNATAKAVPATVGILIQFPLYGGVTAIMTAMTPEGHSLALRLAEFFSSINTRESFPVVMGLYSAALGFFIPSGGGKWVLEAPYVMQAANELKVHLGWAVQVYNAAEALPNLINPFFMLPLLGVLGVKARDIVGFTALQLAFHLPIVLFLLWALGLTLVYTPPVIP
ncbi:short chain fatty acid transporter [Methylocella silvestris BL2]|uniref:Short chain fatty acid transporter n=1 Tax=Methylocella silvestris (strain DSM 15510 / CIP 108128 / LMG 27833 / NCIMB 13906 / BL2) TaxID=395965 RepID=B8ENY5_METSB|nr:TIGR00366 family protein [Methylocella silvestris]ACK49223.1 short chain fatty acid transporter [Methylocella silvestris BL2]